MTHRFHSLAIGMPHKRHICDVEVPVHTISNDVTNKDSYQVTDNSQFKSYR